MKTILVADDEFDIVFTIQALLEADGHRVVSCHDGREALAGIDVHKPDLVILDVMMPVVSGFEVLRTLRGAPRTAETPVILMSAAKPAPKEELPGCQRFLRKPFTLEALMEAVNECLNGSDASPYGGAGV
jgi:CheY-like chemotaxis protein